VQPKTESVKVVQLVEHAPFNLVWAGFDFRPGHDPDLKKCACGLSSLVLGVHGRMQGNDSRAILPLSHIQGNILMKTGHAATARDPSK